MNILGRSLVIVGLLASGVDMANAGDRRVIPVEVLLKRSGTESSSPGGVGLAGVLGYTDDCGLAVYGDPNGAIRRDRSAAVRLGKNLEDVRFPLDSDGIDDYLGNYVYVEGIAIENLSNPALRNLVGPKIFNVFDSARWQLGSHCLHKNASPIQDWVQLADLLSSPSTYVGKTIAVAGAPATYGENGSALYLDEYSAAAGVTSNSVVVACGRSERVNEACNSPELHRSKYAVVVGTVALGKVRGSTPVVLEDIQSLEFFGEKGN